MASNTDIGLKRGENQDRVRVGMIGENSALAVVCDGMGGAQSGAVASELAHNAIFDKIADNYRENADVNSIRNLIITAVHAANTIVYDKSKSETDMNGMGTTCVAVLVRDRTCFIANVGDSRAYLLTDSGIEQVTNDHTYVEMLYEQGQISREEIATHHMKNVITKAVGVEADIDVDYFELELETNFTLLLCTDGLSNYCSEEYIYGNVFGKNLDSAAEELVTYANEQGGKDNITVAMIAN